MGYISLYTIDIALKEIAGFTETKTLYEKIFENDFKRTAWPICILDRSSLTCFVSLNKEQFHYFAKK